MTLHTIPPVFDSSSEILILGSFPSVKSREEGFFYAHPQNRFWKTLAAVYGCDTPQSIDEKKAFLLSKRIALWDVVSSCDIEGSSDSSIKNVKSNDIRKIIDASHIKAVFTNGKKANALYEKYLEKAVGITAVCLPSTSPANAVCSLERLIEVWRDTIKNNA